MTITDWITQGACREPGVDPHIFFLENFPQASNRYRRAKITAAQTCERCPVKRTCLDYAVEHDEKGIWGGTDEDQRVPLRQRRSFQ